MRKPKQTSKKYQVPKVPLLILFSVPFLSLQSTKAVSTKPGGTPDSHNSLPWSSWVSKSLPSRDHFRMTDQPGLGATPIWISLFPPIKCSCLMYSCYFLFLESWQPFLSWFVSSLHFPVNSLYHCSIYFPGSDYRIGFRAYSWVYNPALSCGVGQTT